MKAIRLILLACVAGIFSLSLVGCSGSSSSSSKESSDLYSLRLGVMPSVDYIPVVVAEHLGIYDSLGLDLDLVRFYSPMERDVALQTGQIDGAVSDVTSFLIQKQADMPVEFAFHTYGLFRLVLRPGLTIKSLDDLVGKRFALSSNTVIDYATDQLMRGRAYERVEVQKIPVRLEMLASGQVDAAILPEPFASVAAQQGMTLADEPVVRDVDVMILDKDTPNEVRRKLQEGYTRACEYLMDKGHRDAWLPLVADLFGMEQSMVERIDFGTFIYQIDSNSLTWQDARSWLADRDLVSHP